MADVEDLSEQFSSPALAVGDALANEFMQYADSVVVRIAFRIVHALRVTGAIK